MFSNYYSPELEGTSLPFIHQFLWFVRRMTFCFLLIEFQYYRWFIDFLRRKPTDENNSYIPWEVTNMSICVTATRVVSIYIIVAVREHL